MAENFIKSRCLVICYFFHKIKPQYLPDKGPSIQRNSKNDVNENEMQMLYH